MEQISLASFGDTLKSYRKQKKITQRQLAELLGVHYNTIWAWERGDYLPDTRGTVLEIARHLRLQEDETRHLLEASLTALSEYWNVPYQRNPFFTGRDEMLRRVHELLAGSQEQARACALSGLGGVGKTQTAVEYAYRYFQDYSAVLWLGAETEAELEGGLASLAPLLRLPEEKEQSKVIASVIRWLNTHRDWLLIIDNVENIELMKRSLPAARQGAFLFTTRLPSLSTLASCLPLEPLAPEEGAQFLLRRSGHADASRTGLFASEEYQAAAALAREMGGLPLALDQAGAYIEETQCSISDFLRIFESAPTQILQERQPHADHPLSVTRTFSLAFERLRQKNAAAADLLTLCCLLAPDEIPEEILTKGGAQLGPQLAPATTDPLRYNELLKDLLAYALVRRQPQLRALSLHRLVQAVIRDQLDEQTRRQWATQAVRAVNAVFPTLDELIQTENWSHAQRLLPQALACASLVKEYRLATPESAHLLHRAGYYLRERGQYRQAEELLLQALALYEQIPNAARIENARVSDTLGYLYGQEAKFAEAASAWERACRIYEEELGPENFHTLEMRGCLAYLKYQQGDYARAERLFLDILASYERLPDIEPTRIGELLDNLGSLYYVQKNFEEAERFLLRSSRLYEEVRGPEHPETATALNGLALLYADTGRYQEAEALYLRIISIYERLLEPTHAARLTVNHNLARLYHAQGRDAEAEALFLRVLQDQKREAILLNSAYTSLSLATLYLDQKRYAEAEPLLRYTLEVRERELPLEHPRIARALHHLARFYAEQQRYSEAEPLYRRALQIRERALGPQHVDTQGTRQALAALLRATGLESEAAQLEEQNDSPQGERGR